ncbi:MAG: alpha/beta hydrolase [Alkalispirochaeta sp.]
MMLLLEARRRDRRLLRSVLFVGIAVMAAAGPPVVAQDVWPAYLDTPAEIILPVGYTESRSYPVFVMLPPTGASALQIAGLYGIDPARQRTFILIAPAGRPTRDEYLPDFIGFVERYERRLRGDLAHVIEKYSVDTGRIYLGGYSLGGDLSWALTVRNPALVAGAVVAGSRASYPASDEALYTLSQRGGRVAFLIGDREAPVRHHGINIAREQAEHSEVAVTYREYPGAHVIPPVAIFRDALDWIADGTASPVVTAALPTPDGLAPPSEATRPRRRDRRPTASSPRVGPSGSTSLVDHVSRDRFAITGFLPADIGPRGLTLPNDTEVSGRIELPLSPVYLRTTVTQETTETTTTLRSNRLYHDAVVGIERNGIVWGIGGGWEWFHTSGDGDLFRRADVIFALGKRDIGFLPENTADPARLDSLLLLRYTIPRGIASNPAAEQLFNLRGEYLLRIADRFVIDLAGGSYTVQHAPVPSPEDLPDALDHRWEWEAGVGVRAPSPLLWRLGYRGTAERPLSENYFGTAGSPGAVDDYSGAWRLRGAWRVSVEFSY